MKVRGKWKKTLALLVSLAMLLGMMPDLTLTAVKAAAEENAAESTQKELMEQVDVVTGKDMKVFSMENIQNQMAQNGAVTFLILRM